MSFQPTGEERKIQLLGNIDIDEAPVAYIVALAAVVAVLAFIPFTFILGIGGSFPVSQGIFPLIGWLLGPIAGAVASGVGALAGVFWAPHTAGVWFVSVLGAALASFIAGTMTIGERRRTWWMWAAALAIISWLFYIGRGIFINGVSIPIALLSTFNSWSAILLFLLPTRTRFAQWIADKDLRLVATGIFMATWMVDGMSRATLNAIVYLLYNWPEELWITLITVVPIETLLRCTIGAIIGTGVIAGLRATGLLKPGHALY